MNKFEKPFVEDEEEEYSNTSLPTEVNIKVPPTLNYISKSVEESSNPRYDVIPDNVQSVSYSKIDKNEIELIFDKYNYMANVPESSSTERNPKKMNKFQSKRVRK